MGRSIEIIGAVDFGSMEVRVVIGSRDGLGPVHLIGHGAAPSNDAIAHGMVQDKAALMIALRDALRAAEGEARTRVEILFAGIGGKNVESITREATIDVRGGLIGYEHMASARAAASKDVLETGKRLGMAPIHHEWYIDGLRVTNPANLQGESLRLRVMLTRFPKIIEENLAGCAYAASVQIEDFVYLPMAAGLACLTEEDLELGTAVFDLGRTSTGLSVYRDRRVLEASCIEWGSHHITRDVAAGLQVSFDEAEDLVDEYGISAALIETLSGVDGVPGVFPEEGDSPLLKLKTAARGARTVVRREVLNHIIFERARELMSRARRHLESRGLMKQLVRGVVLTGGASRLNNQAELASALLGCPCRVAGPSGFAEGGIEDLGPEYSGVVGVLLHAFQGRGSAHSAGTIRRASRRMGRFLRRWFY